MRLARVFISIAVLGATLHSYAQDRWNASEYAGNRTENDIQTAMLSKGFTWLSGSPADNEILSIGKNAQLFGFVALRYQSGRAANRGVLGRGFYAIATDAQRELLAQTVINEATDLAAWWDARAALLDLYENYLYTGEEIDNQALTQLASTYARLGANVAIHEARGFAALEDSLSDAQWTQILAWRQNPESAQSHAESIRIEMAALTPDQNKQLENLFAKAFSWFTGTTEDNQIIPLGQPAQFFGFVAIRHKSGHGANRGQIAKSFNEILSTQQRSIIARATDLQRPISNQFLQVRNAFLQQLALLRSAPDAFDLPHTLALADQMGALEAQVGFVEATAYTQIRRTMTLDQVDRMMRLRSDYVIDQTQIETLSHEARGEQLSLLCMGCHQMSEQTQNIRMGPPLDRIFSRGIAAVDQFDYSDALIQLSEQGQWTPNLMNQFLASPKQFAPGTKMEFQGLLNSSDRAALVDFLLGAME